ncbi:MAG: hypothetical protein GY838_13545 [bacterium]|nr:hypothetical protein [bacterium]
MYDILECVRDAEGTVVVLVEERDGSFTSWAKYRNGADAPQLIAALSKQILDVCIHTAEIGDGEET